MKMKHASIALAALLAAGISTANAATSTWDGDTDSFWSTALNWDAAPGVGDNIIFPDVTAQAVDLNAGTFGIGALTFNAPDAYSVANGQLTLGGAVTQIGAGTVALNSTTDLGGANRNFGGAGSGVVSLNGPVTDGALAGARVQFTGGNWVVANSANTVDQFTAGTGAKVIVQGSVASVPDYPGSWYLGGNGTSGGFYGAVDGGTLKAP